MPFLRTLTILWTAACLFWALTVFGAPETHHLFRFFLLLLIPAALALTGLLGRRAFGRKSFPALLAAGILILAGVAWSGHTEAQGYVLLALGWSSLLLAVVVSSEDIRAARLLCFILILIGTFEAIYGLVQVIGGFDYIGDYHRNLGRVATGTLFNRNHFSGLINLILPLGIGVLLAALPARGGAKRHRSEDIAQTWLIVLFCSLLGLASLLSFSRGGIASLLWSLFLAAILLTLRRMGGTRSFLAPAAVWLVLGSTVGLGALVGVEPLLTKFGATESALISRAGIYRDTISLISDNVLGGVGPSMYRWRFPAYQSSTQQVWVNYAHNDYLQTIAEWGLPLATLFWVFVGWRTHRSVRVFWDSRDRWRAGLALGCAVSLFSILIHSLVDFNLYIPVNFAVFCTILGISWALDDSMASQPPRVRRKVSNGRHRTSDAN